MTVLPIGIFYICGGHRSGENNWRSFPKRKLNDRPGTAKARPAEQPGPALLRIRAGTDGPDDPERPRRLDWSKLLKRAYAVDVLTCARCGGPMRLVALIEDERVARR